MHPIHYSNSFIHGKWSENTVRFWVESRLRIMDEVNGHIEDYYQCGACKSEDTFAEKDLFYEDNYDFTPVFGPKHGIVFRRKAYLNENYRSFPQAADMWGGQLYKLKESTDAVLLNTNEEIRQATHDGALLVAQTELRNIELGLRAIIEYPIKTMNTHDHRNMYQVDTGPVLYPNLTKRYERFVDAVSLAYVAFNVSHFADFVIEEPTVIRNSEKEFTQVYHYSRIVSHEADNRIFAMK